MVIKTILPKITDFDVTWVTRQNQIVGLYKNDNEEISGSFKQIDAILSQMYSSEELKLEKTTF